MPAVSLEKRTLRPFPPLVHLVSTSSRATHTLCGQKAKGEVVVVKEPESVEASDLCLACQVAFLYRPSTRRRFRPFRRS